MTSLGEQLESDSRFAWERSRASWWREHEQPLARRRRLLIVGSILCLIAGALAALTFYLVVIELIELRESKNAQLEAQLRFRQRQMTLQECARFPMWEGCQKVTASPKRKGIR